jgi:hypothetical protein
MCVASPFAPDCRHRCGCDAGGGQRAPLQIWERGGPVGNVAFIYSWTSATFMPMKLKIKTQPAQTQACAGALLWPRGCAHVARGTHHLHSAECPMLDWVFNGSIVERPTSAFQWQRWAVFQTALNSNLLPWHSGVGAIVLPMCLLAESSTFAMSRCPCSAANSPERRLQYFPWLFTSSVNRNPSRNIQFCQGFR